MVSHRAHLLEGEHCVFDVGRHASSQQQQVDALRDSTLPPGSRRLIAVNCKYICYCLPSLNSIAILGRNVASRGVFWGHSQRVTDIEFFSEDVHLLASVGSDGRLFVLRIVETVGADREFQLQPRVIFAIQFEGSGNIMQPCVSWHPESQECLLMCLNDLVLSIDIREARKKASHFEFAAGSFLSCPIANLIDGVSCIGKHDADVTDLSVFLRDRLYIASASRDGTVRIWGSGQTSPLAVLMPHEGQPVGWVFFIASLTQPGEAVLLTSDTASKNLKLWVPATSRSSCVWYSVQTLEFRNCNGNLSQQVLPNHYCAVPQAGLVLLGRSENPAIYSVHLKFGNASSAVRMHYLAEFFVSMPILSITAVTETGSSCNNLARIFSVQTQAIQEYFLNISYRLSSQCNEPGLLSSAAALLETSYMKLSVQDAFEAKEESKSPDLEAKEVGEIASGNPGPACDHNPVANPGSGFGSWVEVPSWIAATVKTSVKGFSAEAKATDFKEKNLAYRASPLAAGTGVGSIQSYEEDPSYVSKTAGDISTKPSFVPKPSILSFDLSNLRIAENGILPSFHLTCGPCHGYTNSGKQDLTVTILSNPINTQRSGMCSKADNRQKETIRQDVNARDSAVIDTEVMAHLGGVETVAGVCRIDTFDDSVVGVDQLEVPTEIGSENFEPGVDSIVCAEEEKVDASVAKESLQISGECQDHDKDGGASSSTLQGLSNPSKKKKNRRKIKGSNRANKSTAAFPVVNLAAEKMSLVYRTHEHATTGLSKVVVEDKSDRSAVPSINSLEELSVKILAMQESLDQLLVSQTEIQENVSFLAEVNLPSEIDPPCALLQDCMSYGSTCLDPFWRQSGEKLEVKDALQQEWTHQLCKGSNELLAKFKTRAAPMLMAEVLQSIGSNIGLLISSSIDNVLTTSSLQNVEGCNEQVMKYVEKSLEASLNSSVREQLESTWLLVWKHLMQEELRSYFCPQAILKIEQSCTNKLEHGHFSLCEGFIQSLGLVEQQSSSFDLTRTSSLKDTLLSALSIASSLKEELQDAEKIAWNLTKHWNARYNVKRELTQLLLQGQLEDAFALGLSLGESSLTFWICKQVDLKALLQSRTPTLSQGVILLLVEQLALDLGQEGVDKLAWMEHACLALNPVSHPELCMRMRAALEGVFLLLQQQVNLFTGDAKLANQACLVMHLVNSLRTLCA